VTEDDLAREDAGEKGREERKAKLDDAVEFLERLLADGPVPLATIEQEMGKRGVSRATLRRARERVGGVARRTNAVGAGQGDGGWTLSLPGPK
jgi:hypothetical protein